MLTFRPTKFYSCIQALDVARLREAIVRATAFMERWAEIPGKAPVFGRGNNPINVVSVRDVAAATM